VHHVQSGMQMVYPELQEKVSQVVQVDMQPLEYLKSLVNVSWDLQ
jgi:hypothetical protein